MPIRTGVFETNSSSSHSISINFENTPLQTLPVTDDGEVIITGGSFGWDWEDFFDPQTKASYCATFLIYYPQYRDQLIDCIKEHTGAREVILQVDDSRSYIDHESVGICLDAFESKESLKQFIFNPKSFLTTGNDNSPRYGYE